MKKKILAFLLALCLLTLAVPSALAAQTEEATMPQTQEIRESDQCGEDIRWTVEGSTLYLIGNGNMDDFPDGAPWDALSDGITAVVVQGNITSIGAGAFQDFDALTSVDLGNAMHTVGNGAFKSCDGLTKIALPATFRVFGEESFMSCSNLTEFHFAGGMPSFKLNCLWDTYAELYFPENNPWPLEHIEQLEEAFQGRIEFLSSDGTDPYVPTAPTQAPTVETTEATTEATTQPATEPETTAPTTRPTETTQPETTQAPTQATEEKEYVVFTEETPEIQNPARPSGGPWIGIAIICMVLSLVLLGILIFGRKRRY